MQQFFKCVSPLLVFMCFLGTGHADLNKDLKELKAQYLPAEYANSNFTLDDAKRLIYKKCQKAGVNDTQILTHIENATTQLKECINGIANLTQILDEIEVAQPKGELDEVFHKYCQRQPQAEKCLHNFNDAILPCLTRTERAQNTIMMRIITRLLSFICYKDGDQIAMFIAEEGPECLEANKVNISNCMNATFSAYMPKDIRMTEVTDIPDFIVGPKQCIDLHDFEECVLGYLEQCNEITPANIIESMFRYVRNETKCQPEIDKTVKARLLLESRNVAAQSVANLFALLGAPILVVVVVKYQ